MLQVQTENLWYVLYNHHSIRVAPQTSGQPARDEGQVGASGGGGFGYCCRRLLEVDFETNKTQPDWSFQSFELRGNVTAKPEDVLAPCWRKVPLTGNG